MVQIYCNKCKAFTDTKSEKFTTKKGRTRASGICRDCGTNKGMFVSKNRSFNPKEGEDLDRARFNRIHRSLKKKALSIGWKVLNNEDAQKCVKQYISDKKK